MGDDLETDGASQLSEDIVVRVVRLRLTDRWWWGEEEAKRPPIVGDIGLIVGISGPKNQGCLARLLRRRKRGTRYLVEHVDENIKVAYVADFAADELEPFMS
jgi:hypothetical protein